MRAKKSPEVDTAASDHVAVASRGPKPAHTSAKIAKAAVRIADSEGIGAASMRRVAAELSSGAASLYRYVRNKSELFDLMIDAVLGEDPLPKPSGNWRTDFRRVAALSRELMLRHPWMVTVSSFRATRGTNMLRWMEFSLSAIDGLGLDIDEMLVLSNTLFTYARGYAAGEIGEREASRRSGLSREEWMMTRVAYVRALKESGRFPMFARVVDEANAPHDPAIEERGFTLGLERILDGFAVTLAGQRGRSKRRPRGSKKS
jgi:AcrR family transcriptional regulator